MSGLIRVDLDLIDDDPRNPRGDVGDVSDLKLSLAQDGQQDAIHVIAQGNGRYLLHEGHRRKKALLELGENQAKAVLRRFHSDLDRLVSQGVMHTHSVDWDPMAWATYLYRLFTDHNLNRHQIAHRLGRTPNWVRDTMSFVHLRPFEQQQLAARQMTRTEALRRLNTRRAARDGRPAPAPKTTTGRVPRPRKPADEPRLNSDHQLAEQVAARCASGGPEHAARPKIGGVGCGFCWESVIVADARAARPTLVAA